MPSYGIVVAVLALALPATAAAKSGIEQFSFITTASTGETFSAIATGAFADGGTAVFPNGKELGIVKLSRGTISIKHFGKSHTTNSGSLALCYSKQVQTGGRYTVLGGTGAYKGITGSGTATVSFLDVQPIVGGKCQQKAAPLATQAVIKASGPVTLP